jgi:hypothetical protein
MSYIDSFVPPKSIRLLQSWVDELNMLIKISKPRRTKLGDFRVRGRQMSITINNNLNKYSFLITLTHEIAHAFVFKKYQNNVKPHGQKWQFTFKSLMLNFLTPCYFPDDILKVLSLHMIKPKASTFSDLELVRVLKEYDEVGSFTLSKVAVGESFKTYDRKIFLKGPIVRKRHRCIECQTNKIYFFHPFAEVIKMK